MADIPSSKNSSKAGSTRLSARLARKIASKSLRARLGMLLIGLMMAAVIGQSVLTHTHVVNDLRQLEATQAQSSLLLVQLLLDGVVKPIQDQVQKLGESEQIRSVSKQAEIDQLKRELLIMTRLQPSFDVAGVFDASGGQIFVQGFNPVAPELREPTETETALIVAHSKAADHGQTAPLSGWTSAEEGMFATASHPLITSNGTFNLVLGKYFSAQEIATLEQSSSTHISVLDGSVPPPTLRGEAGIACSALTPRLNVPAKMLCVSLKDSIVVRGQRNISALRLSALLGFLLLMIGTWWFTHTKLLRRLAGLTKLLNATGSDETGQLERAMLKDAARGDEISSMSNGFGRLLGRVRQVEHDLRERERSFRVLAESSGVGIFVVGDVIRYANPFAAQLSGYSNAELLGKPMAELIDEASRAKLAAALELGAVTQLDAREVGGLRRNGTHYWARLDVARIEYQGEAALLVTLFDITEQRHLESKLAFEKQNLQLILNSIHDGIVSVDHAGTVRFINPAAQRLTGIPLELANGSLLEDVVSLSDSEGTAAFPAPLIQHLSALPEKTTLAQISTSKGLARSVEVSITSHDPSIGEGRQGSVMVLRDVSDLRQLTQTLAHQASHDDLTSLINRREFSRRLLRAIDATRKVGINNALCYVDLDQFKLLNDTCGHHAGDLMLREVADALRSAVRENDTLARLGGDEFGVLLQDCTLEHAVETADRLRTTVGDVRFQWNGQRFSVDASIGIVMLEHVEGGIDEALALADAACYMAKDLGRNRVQVYRTSDVDLQAQLKHMRWATRLKEAVENSQFTLFAQAISPVSDRAPELHAFEALIRMKQADGSIVTPDQFIAAAERYQMMSQIDRWVVCTALKALQEQFDSDHPVKPLLFINLSGQSLGDESFRQFLLGKLDEHSELVPHVVFEVTESALIYSLDRAKSLMDEVYARGSAFALDDFGTGMSTFSYLKELRVDYLKIAGCFVKNIADPLDEAVCRSFTDFAGMLKVKVIAEWIEDEACLQKLKAMGVDYGQGWHLAPEGPIREVLQAIDKSA